jgi:hypothetical protein
MQKISDAVFNSPLPIESVLPLFFFQQQEPRYVT